MLGKKRIKLLKTPKPAPAYDRQKEGHGVLRRTTVIMVFFGVLLFLPLFARLFKLMILDHDKYESQAIDVQTRSAAVPADRGTIYDCNMNILAASKTVEDVFIDPLEIHNQKEDVDFIAENLARILNVDADSIRSKAAKLDRRYEVVAYKQEPEQAAAVREFINENDLVGIHLETNSKRYYPSGTTAAQVLGFTNAENRGGEGLEAYYDDVLAGTRLSGPVRVRSKSETMRILEKSFICSPLSSICLCFVYHSPIACGSQRKILEKITKKSQKNLRK